MKNFNKDFDVNNLCYYKHLKYCNKKFYILNNNNQIKINDHIIYYCNNHNTYKFNNIINSKGSKKNFSICNAKIVYYKQLNKYILYNEHSDQCIK